MLRSLAGATGAPSTRRIHSFQNCTHFELIENSKNKKQTELVNLQSKLKKNHKTKSGKTRTKPE
jgi:hypothetical protein